MSARVPVRLAAPALVFLVATATAAAAVPGEVPADARFEGDAETLTWSAAPGATAYNVYRGTDPAAADQTCRVYRTASTSAALPDLPAAPGSLLYFLVSAVNAEGEGSLGTDSAGLPRANSSPCLDSDGDLAADNLDNCPADYNPSQADQDANGAGDRCDLRTYDFEADSPGARPAEMTQLGGSDPTFQVRDLGGDLAAAYDSSAGGQQDRFDRLPAGMSHQDTTVWLDFEEAPATTCTVELWSDGAHGWNAGNGIILQLRSDGLLWYFDRHAQDVPSVAGPAIPENGRLRLRLVKGAGNSSTLHVDAWDGEAFVPDYAVFDVADDRRYTGLYTTVAAYDGGRRAVPRITVEHHVPAAPLTLRKHPSWSSDWKVFQRDALDQAVIPVRFYHRLDEPGRVQARVVESVGGAVLPGHDWTDHETALDPAPSGAGAELLLASVPAGGNYDVEVRLVRDSDSAVLGQASLHEVAVGDVYIAGGQSNMSGYSGNMIGAEEPIDEVHVFHNDGTWKRASEPMDDGTDQVDRVSAENPLHSMMLRFAKDVQAAIGVPVGVIPGPLGGTNLHTQWQRDASDHDNRGTLYGSLLHRVLLQNDPNPPVGYLWFQGESDAGRTTAQYREDLERLMAQYREDLDHPGLYFFIGQLGTYLYANLDDWLAIQEAERQVAKADPRAALATAVDQSRSDTIHFSVEGYKTIGARKALAAREMVYGHPVDALTELVEARLISNGRKIELVYDGDVTDGTQGLYRVYEGTIPGSVKSVDAVGNVITLTLDRRVSGNVTVSYGYSNGPESSWVKDLNGIAVPCFQSVPVTP